MQNDPRLAPSAVKERYRNSERWQKSDDWHRFTALQIKTQITQAWTTFDTEPPSAVLNVGAGNNDLDLCPPSTINVDILESRVAMLPNPLVASVEDLPVADDSIDTVICVSSVIDYCDAARAVSELARVLRPGGKLLLEFESSRSAELIGQRAFGQAASVAESFYAGDPETVWVYSPEYISNLLTSAGLAIEKCIPIHIASPWVLLLTRRLGPAVFAAKLDVFFRELPLLSRWASNRLLFCKKLP